MSNSIIFTTSGTVQAQDGLYLTRQADEELFQLCRDGQYAYILTSRQMGKSSLMVATAERLQAENGVQTAIVDLQRLGAQTTTADKWYFGLLTELARKLRLLPQLMTWWKANDNLGEAQRLVQFLEDVVLPQIEGRLVVFIDEIDSTLSLGFTDDFFIALRYCFTARAENPDFEKLSFVLIGVATPSELIADQKRTPFNIGKLVELSDFSEAEALPLAAGLGLGVAEAQQVLRWILRWTEGHPYLTQRVCEAVVQQPQQSWSAAAVDDLIGELFFGERREQDNNLQFVQSMLTGRAPEADVLGVLGTYRAVRRGRQPVYDEDQSILKAHLKLAGIVKRVGAVLQVRNPIYAQVFDLGWIREQWPESWWERLKPAMPLIVGLTSGVVLLGGLSVYALGQRNAALAEAQRADEAATQADEARDEAEAERERALKAEADAEAALNDAKVAAAEALEQKGIAETASEEANEQRQRAEAAQQAEATQRQQAEVAQQRAVAGEAKANRQAAIAQENAAAERVATERAETETKRAENLALNADLRAESLTVENLMAADLHFSAWLKAMELGQRIQSLEAQTPTPVSYAKQNAKPSNRVSASPVSNIRPEVKLQAASALREIYNYLGYLQRNTLEGHSDWVRSVSFSPDGQTLASASDDGTVKLWDRSGRELQTLEGHSARVFSVSFSPDGQTLASASDDGTVKLWDRSGRELQTLEGHSARVFSVSFSPDGQTLASASDDGTVKLWDRSGRELQTLEGHSDWVRSVSFSPDGQTLASASDDGTVKLWDRSGRELQTLEGHSARVRSVSFSPDGQTLASASDDGTVKLWDRSGRELQTLEGHSASVWSVSFSPDGQTLASASDDGTVKLWDRSGRELQTLEGHSDWVFSVSFSPDGQTLASASDDGTVKLWDRSGRELQTLEGHSASVWSVSFSPDGQTLASASDDGTVKLWDRSGRELQTLEGHSDWVWSVSFSPDGQTLASASYDGTVILWNFDLNDLMAKSCTWLRDYMTNPTTPPEHKALCKDDLPELSATAEPAAWGWLTPIQSALSTLTKPFTR